MTVATGWFRFFWALLALILAAAIAGGLVLLAYQPGRPDVQVLEQEPFTQESSVKDVAALMGGPTETGSGMEYSQAVAANCPTLDIYPLADGAVLICR